MVFGGFVLLRAAHLLLDVLCGGISIVPVRMKSGSVEFEVQGFKGRDREFVGQFVGMWKGTGAATY